MSAANNDSFDMTTLEFDELEHRYGHESACAILRTLEQFEGLKEADVAKLSWHERLKNVCELMKEGIHYQTRH